MRRRSLLCFYNKIYIFYGETPFLLSLYHKTFLCGSFGEKLSQRKEAALSRPVFAGRLFFVGRSPIGGKIINIM